MILVKEAYLARIASQQGWKELAPGPNGMSQRRRDGELPHYLGEGCHNGKSVVFYDLKLLEELWGVKFDRSRLGSKHYVRVEHPEEEGFEFVPAKTNPEELSDYVS